MWRARTPPTPLDFDAIINDNFVLPREQPSLGNTHSPALNGTHKVGAERLKHEHGNTNGQTPTSSSAIKDQRALSLKDNLLLFLSRLVLFSFVERSDSVPSTNRLAARLRAGEETISFDKDDDDTLDFVTSSSNLRSVAYGIDGKTRWEVKGVLLF